MALFSIKTHPHEPLRKLLLLEYCAMKEVLYDFLLNLLAPGRTLIFLIQFVRIFPFAQDLMAPFRATFPKNLQFIVNKNHILTYRVHQARYPF